VKSPELLEYLAFPKILGVAERAWNSEPAQPQDSPEAWAQFANRLGQQVLPRLGAFARSTCTVSCRMPSASTIAFDAGRRHHRRHTRCQRPVPGLAIELSTDGGRTWRESRIRWPCRDGSRCARAHPTDAPVGSRGCNEPSQPSFLEIIVNYLRVSCFCLRSPARRRV